MRDKERGEEGRKGERRGGGIKREGREKRKGGEMEERRGEGRRRITLASGAPILGEGERFLVAAPTQLIAHRPSEDSSTA